MEQEIQHRPAPVSVIPEVQGMHCLFKGIGTVKATVTMSDISITVYDTVPLFTFTLFDVTKRFKRLAMVAGTNINQSTLEQDFADLLKVCGKVQKTNMALRSGDRITTYTLGTPVVDETDGFLHLSPEKQEWWSHPNVEPIVESIQKYLPGFSPWLLQKDSYIAILSQKSGLF